MKQRFDFTVVAAEGYKAMLGVHSYVQNSGLDLGLLELVKIRVSQINGCAFCLAMHIPLARKHGVSDEQLNLLVAWREAPVFSNQRTGRFGLGREHDLPGRRRRSDPIYEQACQQFSTKEIADLSFAVAEINAWNRLMVCSRTPPQVATDKR